MQSTASVNIPNLIQRFSLPVVDFSGLIKFINDPDLSQANSLLCIPTYNGTGCIARATPEPPKNAINALESFHQEIFYSLSLVYRLCVRD